MSFFRNTVRRPSPPAPAALSRLFRYFNFYFQAEALGLSGIYHSNAAEPALLAGGFLPASAAIHFSDPATGGAKPKKLTTGQVEPARPAFGETKTTNQKKQ